jgi:hypothetical protein
VDAHREWGKHPMDTYVRSRTLEELRDHLPAEKLRVTEDP